MRSLALALLPLLLLSGCATDRHAEVDPQTAKMARVLSELRAVQDQLAAVNRNVDDLQSRVSASERENRVLEDRVSKTFAQEREELNALVGTLKRTRDDAIQQSVEGVLSANAQEIDALNRKLASVVETVRQQNEMMQSQVLDDVTALQRDLKAVKVQVNAFMDKTDRLERQVRAINEAGVPARAAQRSASRGSSSRGSSSPPPAAKEEIIRTGTPSDPSIDYSQGYEHTIVKGETLWKIARDYGVAVQDILNTNPDINDTTMLKPGQTLFVPLRK